jgi:hypothetical protein
VLRFSLASFGLAVALGTPALAAGDSRYVLLLEAPWQADQTVDSGRKAGGMLVQSGWHSALFYFPEGIARPASLAGAITIPIRRPDPVCNGPKQTELP